MTAKPMHVNAYTYYGTATTTSGSTPVAAAKLPNLNLFDRAAITNHSTTDFIAFAFGGDTVTVAFPASDDTATNMTIVPPGQSWLVDIGLGKTRVAADSLTGSALFTIQYGNENP